MSMVVERYQRGIYGRCRLFFGNDDDAREAMQLTWKALVQYGNKLVGIEAIGPWLQTISRNKCIDLSRKRKRSALKTREIQEEIASDENLAERLRTAQEHHALEGCLKELDEVDRLAVVSRYFDGCSWEEIGRELEMAPDTIRMRVKRGAMQRLLECMKRKERPS